MTKLLQQATGISTPSQLSTKLRDDYFYGTNTNFNWISYRRETWH